MSDLWEKSQSLKLLGIVKKKKKKIKPVLIFHTDTVSIRNPRGGLRKTTLSGH